jgi:hypothetical protein
MIFEGEVNKLATRNGGGNSTNKKGEVANKNGGG